MKYTSALMTAASGSLRGIVAAHNRGGAYFRGKVIPTNPSSVLQGIMRAAFRTAVTAWTTVLTSTQRTNWGVYATNTPTTDTLGNALVLTGQQMYIRQAAVRTQASLTPAANAPTTYDLGTFTPPTLTLAANSTAATLAFSTADVWWSDANTTGMLVYTSAPQNGSINFFKGPFRFAAKVLANATSPANVTLPQAAGASTAKTFFQVRVSRTDGRLSNPFLGSGTV